MTRKNRFIVRVDDVGQLPDQSKPDVGLRYFKSWHAAGGWDHIPMYLGVVPGVMSRKDIVLAQEHVDKYGGELCIHGYDHKREVLPYDDVTKARSILPGVRCVIPPYNMYDSNTINAMVELNDKPVLFGGLPTDHEYGDAPVVVNGVLHLSAEPSLYQHSYLLCEAIRQLPLYDYPVVITFHHRWDHANLSQARSVASLIRESCVLVDEAWSWVARQEA